MTRGLQGDAREPLGIWVRYLMHRCREPDHCLIKPQLLKDLPRQQPVLRHCCCRFTQTVAAQLGSPVVATQATAHFPRSVVQLKLVCDGRFADGAGSLRAESTPEVLSVARVRTVSPDFGSDADFRFADAPSEADPTCGFSRSSEFALDGIGVVADKRDQTERHNLGVSVRTPAPDPSAPSNLIAILYEK